MDVKQAQAMMAEAVEAMLATGQFKIARALAVRGTFAGEMESVTCLLFGDSEEVLTDIAARVKYGQPDTYGWARLDEALASDAESGQRLLRAFEPSTWPSAPANAQEIFNDGEMQTTSSDVLTTSMRS